MISVNFNNLFIKKGINIMLSNYTARYVKTESGYMGQLLEWPEVVTEGNDLEECRTMLKDALNEMTLAYKQLGKEVPFLPVLFEQLPVNIEYVS